MGGLVGTQEVSLGQLGIGGHASKYAALTNALTQVMRFLTVVLGFVIPLSTTATEVVLLLVFLCWLCSGDYAGKLQTIWRSKVAVLSLAMFAAYAIGVVYSTAALPEAADALWKYRKLVYLGILLTIFTDGPTREHAVRAFLVAMVVTLVASLLMSWGLVTSKWGDAADCSAFKNHIAQNTLMAFFVVVLADRARVNRRLRWLYSIVILLAVYNILFMVAGRTGQVILFALVCLLMYEWKGLRGLGVAAMLVTCLAAAGYNLSGGFRERIDTAMQEAADYYYWHRDTPESSIGRRLACYKTGLRILRQDPLLGTGTGSFRGEFMSTPGHEGKEPITSPHSAYFDVLVQTGVFGMGLFLYWLYAQWVCSRGLPPELGTRARALVVMLVVGGLFNALLASTTEGWIYCYFAAMCFAGAADPAHADSQESTGGQYIANDQDLDQCEDSFDTPRWRGSEEEDMVGNAQPT